MKNISNFRPQKPALYPEYINITECEKGVSIEARRSEIITSGGQIKPGHVIEIKMTENEFKRFIDDAQRNFKPSLDPNQLDMLV